MTSMSVVTPSYAPDFDLCRDLHESVLRFMPPTVHHHVVVPRSDLALFAPLRGPRCTVWLVDDFLPRHIRRLGDLNVWINARRPWPPVRGWVMQQVVKLGAAEHLDDDVLLFVDSDICFVRAVTVDTYRRDGRLMLYRKANAVHADMPRHVLWHQTARRLLGLAPESLPLHDYVAAPNAWDRTTARGLHERLSSVNGRPWVETICSSLHISEFFLYGVYVEDVLGGAGPESVTDRLLCHNHWGPEPLDPVSASEFLGRISRDDVAVMISAKSNTSLEVRRAAIARLVDGRLDRD